MTIRWTRWQYIGAGAVLLVTACGDVPGAIPGTSGSTTSTGGDPSADATRDESTSAGETSSSTGEPETTTGGLASSSTSDTSSSTAAEDACEPPILAENVILESLAAIAQERADDPGDPTHHFITVYETRLFGVDAPITFNLPGNNVLILSSTTPAQWGIELGPLGALDQVIVFGEDNRATVPEGVTLTELPALTVNNCADNTCRLTTGIAEVEARLGIEVDSGDAAYRAQFYEYEPPQECGGTPFAGAMVCSDPDGVAGAAVDACDAILQESMSCLVLSGDDELRLVGLDSGDDCSYTSFTAAIDYDFDPATSIGWIGDDAYLCAGTVVRVDTTTGSVDDTGVACEMVTELGGSILVHIDDFPSGVLRRYAGYDELIAGITTSQVDVDTSAVAQLSADGSAAYYGWFADDSLSTFDIATGEQQPDAALLCHDSYIHGFDVVDGTAYVLDSSVQVVYVLDPATGDIINAIAGEFGGASARGLACRTNP